MYTNEQIGNHFGATFFQPKGVHDEIHAALCRADAPPLKDGDEFWIDSLPESADWPESFGLEA